VTNGIRKPRQHVVIGPFHAGISMILVDR